MSASADKATPYLILASGLGRTLAALKVCIRALGGRALLFVRQPVFIIPWFIRPAPDGLDLLVSQLLIRICLGLDSIGRYGP